MEIEPYADSVSLNTPDVPKIEIHKPDTRDVHSSLAFSILMEGPYRQMAERIGMTRIGIEGDWIVFQVGPKLVEIGRGLTVRQALEDAYRHWNSKSE